MDSIVGDGIGLVHLISSVLALIFGTAVLLLTKGTNSHKKMGYGYVVSMVVLLVTSFMIYRLFNGWGIFHYSAIVSVVTLAGGMIPILTKKPDKSWAYFHFTFMYWSVIGLYAAFVSEIMTRIPDKPFYNMLGLAIGLVMFAGVLVFIKNKNRWYNIFMK